MSPIGSGGSGPDVEAGHAGVVFGTALWDISAYASGLGIERDRHRLLLESWSRKQAVRHVGESARTLDLIWIEEPVRRWDADGPAAVSRGVRTAVASGEDLTGLEQFRPLIAAGGVEPEQAGRRLFAVTPGPCRSTAEGTFDTIGMEDR